MEKQSWASSAGASSSTNPGLEEAKRLWDTEKAELVKANEEAKAQVKVCIIKNLVI
jgi:hypothetical protein